MFNISKNLFSTCCGFRAIKLMMQLHNLLTSLLHCSTPTTPLEYIIEELPELNMKYIYNEGDTYYSPELSYTTDDALIIAKYIH
jgi:hypothetical protein